jgi:hypothetical protein
MLNPRAIFLIAVLAICIFLISILQTPAAEVDCKEVRALVALARSQGINASKVAEAARANGATEEQIKQARDCLREAKQ